MIKWEYIQVIVPNDASVEYACPPEWLENIGNKGWELVTVVERTRDRVWVFKRRARADTLTSTQC